MKLLSKTSHFLMYWIRSLWVLSVRRTHSNTTNGRKQLFGKHTFSSGSPSYCVSLFPVCLRYKCRTCIYLTVISLCLSLSLSLLFFSAQLLCFNKIILYGFSTRHKLEDEKRKKFSRLLFVRCHPQSTRLVHSLEQKMHETYFLFCVRIFFFSLGDSFFALLFLFRIHWLFRVVLLCALLCEY